MQVDIAGRKARLPEGVTLTGVRCSGSRAYRTGPDMDCTLENPTKVWVPKVQSALRESLRRKDRECDQITGLIWLFQTGEVVSSVFFVFMERSFLITVFHENKSGGAFWADTGGNSQRRIMKKERGRKYYD